MMQSNLDTVKSEMQSSLSLKQPERKVPDVENPDIQMLLTRDSDGSKCNSNYPYPCSTDHFAWNSVIDCKFGWTGFKFPGYGLWGYLCLCFNPLLGEIMFLIARLSVITGVRFRCGVHVSLPSTQPSNPAPIGSLDLPAYMKRCAVAAVFRPRILWLIAKHTRLSRWPDLPGRHQRFLESSCRPEDFRNHQIPWLDYSYSYLSRPWFFFALMSFPSSGYPSNLHSWLPYNLDGRQIHGTPVYALLMEKQAVSTRSTHITGARKHSDAEQRFTNPRGSHWKSHDQMLPYKPTAVWAAAAYSNPDPRHPCSLWPSMIVEVATRVSQSLDSNSPLRTPGTWPEGTWTGKCVYN